LKCSLTISKYASLLAVVSAFSRPIERIQQEPNSGHVWVVSEAGVKKYIPESVYHAEPTTIHVHPAIEKLDAINIDIFQDTATSILVGTGRGYLFTVNEKNSEVSSTILVQF
jgi:hypothetical protein